jgi:hypothetical protein
MQGGCSGLTPDSSPFNIQVLDLNGNAMPAGTTISLSTNNGTIKTATSIVVPSTNACKTGSTGCGANYQSDTVGVIPVSMVTDAVHTIGPPATCTDPSGTSGYLTVMVTTPLGLITTVQIPVYD